MWIPAQKHDSYLMYHFDFVKRTKPKVLLINTYKAYCLKTQKSTIPYGTSTMQVLVCNTLQLA